MKKIFTLLSLIIVILVFYNCSTKNEVKLPEPHQNFIGEWVKDNDLIISVKPDSIIISRFRDKSRVIEIPSTQSEVINVIKNNENVYEIEIERNNGLPFPIKHSFEYTKEDNTIKYVDKILSKKRIE